MIAESAQSLRAASYRDRNPLLSLPCGWLSGQATHNVQLPTPPLPLRWYCCSLKAGRSRSPWRSSSTARPAESARQQQKNLSDNQKPRRHRKPNKHSPSPTLPAMGGPTQSSQSCQQQGNTARPLQDIAGPAGSKGSPSRLSRPDTQQGGRGREGGKQRERGREQHTAVSFSQDQATPLFASLGVGDAPQFHQKNDRSHCSPRTVQQSSASGLL